MRTPLAVPPDAEDVEAVVGALLDPALAAIVDLVVTADDQGYQARAVDGRVRFTRAEDGAGWAFTETLVDGRNPLGDQATAAASGASTARWTWCRPGPRS